MEIKRLTLSAARQAWINFETNNTNTKVFHYFDIVNLINSHYLFFSAERKEFPRFYGFFENGKCVAIAPMCKRYSRSGNYYTSFGAIADLAHQDFVFGPELTQDSFNECFSLLLRKLKNIKFYRVPDGSLLKSAIDLYGVESSENVNVAIQAEDDYDSYFGRLSKSVKQNVRTAYNRMNTDEKEYTIHFHFPGNITSKELNEVMDVYIRRREEHYGLKFSKRLQEWFLRHYHYNTIGFSTLPEGMYAILRIDGKVAAFWGGYVEREKRYVIVPRLAINEEFKRYSPGYILINETMKVLKKEFGIECLDLSKGEERYKYDMGGQPYKTYDYHIQYTK